MLWMVAAFFLTLLAISLYVYLEARAERGAERSVSLTGQELLDRFSVPYRVAYRDGFNPLSATVWIRRKRLASNLLLDLAVVAHKAAHVRRIARQEASARVYYALGAARLALLGCGLALIAVGSSKGLGVIFLAVALSPLFIPEELQASAEALSLLGEQGLSPEDLDRIRNLLRVYALSRLFGPLAFATFVIAAHLMGVINLARVLG